MIMRKLNPRVYDSLLVLLDSVRLYKVYRWLDTLPLYIYYELLVISRVHNRTLGNINAVFANSFPVMKLDSKRSNTLALYAFLW